MAKEWRRDVLQDVKTSPVHRLEKQKQSQTIQKPINEIRTAQSTNFRN